MKKRLLLLRESSKKQDSKRSACCCLEDVASRSTSCIICFSPTRPVVVVVVIVIVVVFQRGGSRRVSKKNLSIDLHLRNDIFVVGVKGAKENLQKYVDEGNKKLKDTQNTIDFHLRKNYAKYWKTVIEVIER